MRFLYRRLPIPLENICDKWHLIGRQAGQNGYRPFDSPEAAFSSKGLAWLARDAPGKASMLDIIMLAIGLGFFALSVGYTIACDRL